MIRALLIILLMTSCSLVWGAGTKEALNQARSNYQQAVSTHGRKSPEARQARHNLRVARRAFHNERRSRMQNRHPR